MTGKSPRTDWEKYYSSPFPTAKWLRNITRNRLTRALKKCGFHPDKPIRIVELGGGGSSFAEHLCRTYSCSLYTAVDSSREGLDRFSRLPLPCGKAALLADVTAKSQMPRGELVFSAGLIEHFDKTGTERAVRAHFLAVSDDGWAAFLFPADTILYRIIRKTAELCGLWRFPDERALTMDEVIRDAEPYGKLVHKEMIRSIFLTQALLIFRYAGSNSKL